MTKCAQDEDLLPSTHPPIHPSIHPPIHPSTHDPRPTTHDPRPHYPFWSVNRARRRIASTNQHPTDMGTEVLREDRVTRHVWGGIAPGNAGEIVQIKPKPRIPRLSICWARGGFHRSCLTSTLGRNRQNNPGALGVCLGASNCACPTFAPLVHLCCWSSFLARSSFFEPRRRALLFVP